MAIANDTSTSSPDKHIDQESLLDKFTCPGRKQLKLKKIVLPFVAVGKHLPAADDWDVPPTGGCVGGEETGHALARMLMKQLRHDLMNKRPSYTHIHDVITSLMIRFEEEGGKAMSDMGRYYGSDRFTSVEGQIYGFIDELSESLDAALQGELGSWLNQISYEELLAQANKGLCFDQRAYYKHMDATNWQRI